MPPGDGNNGTLARGLPGWPSKAQDRILEPSPAGPNAVPDLLDRLKTALADRYVILEEVGAGGVAAPPP